MNMKNEATPVECVALIDSYYRKEYCGYFFEGEKGIVEVIKDKNLGFK